MLESSETVWEVAWDERFFDRRAFFGNWEDFRANFMFPQNQTVIKLFFVDYLNTLNWEKQSRM
jgi:hypothetical protein